MRLAKITWRKPVTEVSFDPDGRRFVVVGNDRLVRVYDATVGRLAETVDQGGLVTSAELSGPRKGLLVTTGANDVARIWRLRDGALLHQLRHRGSVLDAAFSPGAWRVATASADGTGRIWNTQTGAPDASIVGHKGIVRSVAFSPDGNLVVTGSDDRTAKVSKVVNGDVRASLDGHDDVVGSVRFSPDGSTVLTASNDGTARLWDPRTQPRLNVLMRSRGPVLGATYAGPNAIAVAGPGSRLRLVRSSDGRPLSSYVLSGRARDVASSTDGRVVVGAGPQGLVVLRPGGGERKEFALPGATAVALSVDGSTVAGGAADGTGRIWSTDGRLRHELRGHSGPITDAAFSHDGARVATSSVDGTVRIWGVATGEALRTLPGRKGVLSVAFSPDDSLVLTAGLDHTAQLWDSITGERLQVLRRHLGRVADANFSPDGRWIVTAGRVIVGLWTPGTPEPILRDGFGGEEPLLTSATFDPTSRFVLSSSTDGTVRRAACDVCAGLVSLLERAEAQLAASGRVVTAQERERYGLD
jgi:WD40 repeat protein